MKTFFTWLSGLLEDHRGRASSKRAGFYWAFALLTYMIISSVNGREVIMEMFWGIVGLILVGYGMITSEFFKNKTLKSFPGDINQEK